MTTLTIEYLRNNYPSLAEVSNDDLKAVLNKLKKDWIGTIDELNRTTRDSLVEVGYPLRFVDAVKPKEKGTCVCALLLYSDRPMLTFILHLRTEARNLDYEGRPAKS